MAEWLSMGGRGAFVWSAYGITAFVLIVNWVWLKHQVRAAATKSKRLAKPNKTHDT
jgi:heme exporter protein CcmD